MKNKAENTETGNTETGKITKKAAVDLRTKKERCIRARMKNPPGLGPMTIVFTFLVAVVLIATMLITSVIFGILYHLGILNGRNGLVPFMALLIFSIIFGTILAFFFCRGPLHPVDSLLQGMKELAAGNYEVRLQPVHRGYGVQVTDQFNILAKELGNTEMLRSDFVNNFSHEFKTPIVSIRGFARLIQKGGLTEECQSEYIDIIVEEASRLSDMATNVLSLTKLENQSILNEVVRYNVSEQIRTCILLLEKKWTAKRIELHADFEEYEITANEEMMKQVWINLLDNAVKFCDEGGQIEVNVYHGDGILYAEVVNTGKEIPEEEEKRIFQKFFQGDTSHASEGNGIGLAIVKRVLLLHGGKIMVDSENGRTAFKVGIPQKQTLRQT
ncbi:MAG: HAMP domain-containing sensor histidine kinase [Lachnospiraceae bacterium]|nr:HAMP domain-containing sensor histidine kinase [Lachnospiraceae bacterium]